MAMKLSTGKVAFPIEFDNGDEDCIYFNPNDPDLYIRFTEFEKRVNERFKDIQDIELNNEGTPKDANFVERFNDINTIMYEELDIAFGSEVSKIIFKHCSPFAIVNNEYFLIQFVNAIKPEIYKHTSKAQKELQKNIEKHTNKYIS